MHINMNGNMHMQKNMQVGTCRPFSKTEGIQLCNLYSLFPKAVLNSLEPFSKGKLKIMAQMSKAPAFSKAVAFSKAEWCSFFPKSSLFPKAYSSLLIQLGAEVKLWPCELEVQ